VARAIVGLQLKLSIEVLEPATNHKPTTYLIYSYKEILVRRRAAGLTHVLHKGVFVQPAHFDQAGLREHSDGDSDMPAAGTALDGETAAAVNEGVDEGAGTACRSAVLPDSGRGSISLSGSASNTAISEEDEVIALRQALLEIGTLFTPQLGTPNRGTARNILLAARQKFPSCTVAEVAWIVRNLVVDRGHRFESWGGIVFAAREDS
jgi:hypothetical protein